MPNKNDQVAIELRVTGADQAAGAVDRVTSSEEALARETQQAGLAARQSLPAHQQRTQAAQILDGRLRRLVDAQVQHDQAVQSGAKVSTEDQQRAARRAALIDRVAQRLANVQQRQERVNEAVRESVQRHREEAAAVARVESADQRRIRQLDAKRQRLVELQRRELQLEEAVRRGTVTEERAAEISRRRQGRVDRLAQSLRVESAAQRRANTAIQEGGGAAEKTGFSVAGLARSFSGLAGGLTAAGGVLAALRLVRAELEQIERLQGRAFQTQKTIASAERDLKLNLPGASDEEIQQAVEAARTLAEDRSIPIRDATLAIASGLTATGSNLGRAVDAADIAAQIRPDQPAQIPELTAALGGLGNSINDPDAIDAFGFLNIVAGKSRIADPSLQFRNIPTAIAGLVNAGFDNQSAGSLFAALTLGSDDRTGEQTGTASINLAEQLKQFFAEQGRDEVGLDAIRAIQADPQLQEQFLEGLTIEAKSRGSVRNLLTDPDSQVAREFDSSLALFGDDAQIREAGEDKLRQLADGQLEANAQLNRDLASANDQLQAGNTTFGTVGAIRDQIVPLLENSGNSALATKFDKLNFDLSSFSSPDDALDQLDELIQEQARRVRARALSSSSAGPGAPGITSRRPLTQSEREAIETLNRARRIINDRRGVETPTQFIENSTLRFGTNNPFSNDGPFEDIEVDDPATRQPERGVHIDRRVINNGTLINNAQDPRDADLSIDGEVP